MMKPGSRPRDYGYKPQGKKMQDRPRSRDEYHSARWTRESRVFRSENPLCKRCAEKGIVKASEVTDHVIPPTLHGDFWDKSNWQALCRKCNIEKGNEQKKLFR